jgi:hypothetical protein
MEGSVGTTEEEVSGEASGEGVTEAEGDVSGDLSPCVEEDDVSFIFVELPDSTGESAGVTGEEETSFPPTTAAGTGVLSCAGRDTTNAKEKKTQRKNLDKVDMRSLKAKKGRLETKGWR